MKKLTSYLTAGIFQTTAVVTGTLVLIIWLTQALRFVDLVLSKGLPLQAFFTLTLFLTPDLIVTILPFGLLIGSVFTFYRLQGDSEVTVLKALGASPWQLLKGPFYLSVLLAFFMIVANMVILPASFRHFKDKEYALRQSDAPIHIRPRVFQNFGKMMVYVQQVSSTGQLKGILVYDKRLPGNSMTYTADLGAWVFSDNSLRLMLNNGTQQQFTKKNRPPDVLQFNEYYLDLAQTKIKPREGARKPFELGVRDLLKGAQEDKKLSVEMHRRILNPLLSILFVLLGLTLLLKAPYNRRSRIRPTLLAMGSNFFLQVIVLILLNRSETIPLLVWLVYLMMIGVGGGAFYLLNLPKTSRILKCLGA
ncbi:LptF/LptG family permease [Alphaproteobacteria bacterium]|nr:LptF/LptG family permease [Alphaproteobacteria bacterium]